MTFGAGLETIWSNSRGEAECYDLQPMSDLGEKFAILTGSKCSLEKKGFQAVRSSAGQKNIRKNDATGGPKLLIHDCIAVLEKSIQKNGDNPHYI